jgi:hypothetical protein
MNNKAAKARGRSASAEAAHYLPPRRTRLAFNVLSANSWPKVKMVTFEMMPSIY